MKLLKVKTTKKDAMSQADDKAMAIYKKLEKDINILYSKAMDELKKLPEDELVNWGSMSNLTDWVQFNIIKGLKRY